MAETRRTNQALPPELEDFDPERELPPASDRTNPRLNQTAEAIGEALGTAARHVQDARDRFTVIRGGAEGGPPAAEQLRQQAQAKAEEIRDQVEDLKDRAGNALERARIEAGARLQDARVRASRLAGDARDAAAERARLLRSRAQRLIRERPLPVLAGIGIAAFVLGIILRAGRNRRG